MVAAAAPTVWAVTGATRGMGLEFCTQILSLHNTKVIAGARPGENADDLQALSEKYEGRVMIVQMELLDKESVKAAIQRVQEAHVGGVDYLINNAGVLGQYSRAQDQDIDDLRQVLMINVVGTFAVTKAFLPMLKSSNKKTIVNISSDAACLTLMFSMIDAEDGMDAGMGLSYKASKVAVNMETAILANDLKKDGFTIVSLHPGFVNTNMGQNVKASTDGMRNPTRSPQEAVGEMMQLTLGLTTKDNGKYMLHDGTDMPW